MIFLRPITEDIAGNSANIYLNSFHTGRPSTVFISFRIMFVVCTTDSYCVNTPIILLQPQTLLLLLLMLPYVDKDTVPQRVQSGVPVAQLYGLGAPWAFDGSHNKNFNRTAVCGANSPCLQVTPGYGGKHFR